MLSKEELLKNYEKLNKAWLINAPYILLGDNNAGRQALIDNSERYAIISKIGHILYHSKNYEAEINKIIDNLTYKFSTIWERSLVKTYKKACHWKSAGFKSKESYRDYLEDKMYDIYSWNSDDAYKANIIKNQLNDISIITKEDYISDYYDCLYD